LGIVSQSEPRRRIVERGFLGFGKIAGDFRDDDVES
jgi:hypothetical protein